MSHGINKTEPTFEVIGDEPLSDEAIAAIARLLLHLVEKEDDEGNQVTENEICREKDTN